MQAAKTRRNPLMLRSLRPFAPSPKPAHSSASGAWSVAIVRRAPTRRWLAAIATLGACTLFAGYVAMRSVPWFGPFVADTLRAAVGIERVALLEQWLAAAEDRVEQTVHRAPPRSLADSMPEELLVASGSQEQLPQPEQLTLPDVGPLFAATANSADGTWQDVPLRSGNGAMVGTLIHPDPERVYAELSVFALDLKRLRLHAVAGSVEPKRPEDSPELERPGVVPQRDREQLVAAFNGGFKAEHGHFGMMVDGTELLAPRKHSCTLAAHVDGSLQIAPWSRLSARAAEFSWWRQTPGCMLEDGVLHPGLSQEDSRNWGATLEGKTVIRRSAVGLSRDGRTLFVGISNYTTARALALGMQHVGAVSVAQLDVNFSYPRFLLYQQKGAELKAIGAVKGLLYKSDEYVGRPSTRDFFYVTAK